MVYKYSANYVVFDMESKDFSRNIISDFIKKVNAKDVIVIRQENAKYRCFCNRRNNGKFRMHRGEKSLGKKIKIDPNSLSIIPCGRRKMPDYFLVQFLDPYKSINEQVMFSIGKFKKKHYIKNCLEKASCKSNEYKNITHYDDDDDDDDDDDGSVGQLKKDAVKACETELNELKDNNNNIEDHFKSDVPKGIYVPFRCFKTNKLYRIFSENERLPSSSSSSSSEVVQQIQNNKKNEREDYILLKDDHGEEYVQIEGYKNDHPNFVKRKHYYFYSKNPGYGKTTFILKLLRWLNASQVTDTHNWMNISKYAQFLVIDEFSPDKKITLGNLKTLTSGDASAFAGNRKSHGLTFQPRKDAQLIIFSNYHLFDVMGTKNLVSHNDVRQVTQQTAKILKDRFFIHRLDESESNEIETEKFDSYLHTQEIRHN